jgi:hypothetical protein
MFNSDDFWDTEAEARQDAERFAHKFHIEKSHVQIYKTTIEVF